MKISEFSVKNSLLINLISLLVLIAGFYTIFIFKIKKEAFPEVAYGVVLIQTVYPGASPIEIEKLVTVPLEKELKGVDGVEEMISSSLDNISTIKIEISSDVKDNSKVVDDIREAVNRVNDLPDETEDPIITEITTGEIPVIELALSGDISEKLLQEYAKNLEDLLEDIPGVSSISRKGWRDQEVWVEVDPMKMAEYRVSLEDVIQSLKKQNMNIPGGRIRGVKEFSIRTTGEFYTVEEIGNVVIRANDLGNWLRIRDVGTVKFTFEEEDKINKSRGTRSITLIVIKRSSGDAVKVVDKAKEIADKFVKETDSRLNLSFVDDMSFYIKRRLGVLRNNGIIGLFLVLCVLMIFLDKRIAILTALGIPIAFSATLAVMGFFDISINLISMFGLIMVLGMLVDDGIIVAENCSRHLEDGLSPRKAAIKGTEEVVRPVTTTILTTIAAFFPLMFLSGIMGKFIWAIPVVVTIALIASLFEALVILPSHFADFVKVGVGKKFVSKKELPWFKSLLGFYTKVLNKALNKRYVVFLGLIIALAATFVLATNMKFILFGGAEIEQFYIRAEAPIGTNIYKTEELTKKIEEKVKALPDSELDAFTTQVGSTGQSFMFDPYAKSGGHTTQVTVYLTPQSSRKRTVPQIMDSLRKDIGKISGFKRLYFEKEHSGPPVGKAIAVQLRGDDFAVLDEISAKIQSFLKGVKGVSDVISDYDIGKGEMLVVIDQEKAASTYLSVSEIASTVRATFKGGLATSIKPTKAEEEIDVLVKFPEQYRNDSQAFDKILIPNKFKNLIPLNRIAKIEERVALATIRHLDGKRVITVRADVDEKNMTSFAANKILAQRFKDLPKDYPGYSITYGGEQEESMRSARDFKNAFLIAFFLIFMILAASMNSLMQPLIVMMAILFGLIGVIWSFFFHGLPISFFMMMGTVALIGIVVNDSIVLVEFINNLRRRGVERRESIVQGGQLRLRPVILTTITTACGLAPTAYGIWGGDPFLKPMALAIVWGIICATALTLIVIPCIYAIIDDITLKITGHTTIKRDDAEVNGIK